MQIETSTRPPEPGEFGSDLIVVNKRYLKALEELAHFVSIQRRVVSPVNVSSCPPRGPFVNPEPEINERILRLYSLSP